MRWPALLLLTLLAGCAEPRVYTTLCGMGPGFRGWEGVRVRFPAILFPSTRHGSPKLIDMRCAKVIGANWSRLPQHIQNLAETPGLFNKTAVVSGKIYADDRGHRVLLITGLEQLAVDLLETEAEKQAIFERMLAVRNARYKFK
jgi:hypothetical protein